MVFCHIFACLWNIVANWDNSQNNWITRLQLDDATPGERYLTGFYWITQTVITVGYGDIGAATDGERIMSIIAMCAGVLFFSLMVGSLTSIINEMDVKNSLYENKARILDQIIDNYDITDPKLLLKLHNAIKSKIYGNDENFTELLQSLPKRYAVALSAIIYKPVVKGIKFFQQIENDFLWAIGPHLQTMTFTTNETITHRDEYPNEVYFLKKGAVGLVTPQYRNEVFMTINEGSYFGETDIIFNTTRKFGVIAITPCEIVVLERKEFIKIFFKEFKEQGRTMKQYAELRLVKQLKTYDLFINIMKEHNERKMKASKSPQNRTKERIINEYLPFLAQDTFKENEIKFSPSFQERNHPVMPKKFDKKEEEDILLENVSLSKTHP